VSKRGSAGDVLIVEDDPDVRDVLCEVLRDEGYGVVGAANGLEALQRLRSGAPPCLILLDLMMPVMNGWEFRAEQQRDAALREIPVVILSGNGNMERDAGELGAAVYLSKPMNLDTLLAIVARYCR
jgi:CheY-like chemotaxis protein